MKNASPRPAVALFFLFVACNAHTQCPPPATAASAESGGPSTVVARIGERAITLAEVDKKVGHDLFELREQALEKLINERVVGDAAKAAGQSVEEFVEKQVDAKKIEVSEAEAETFFKQNKERLPPQFADKTFADLKPVLIGGLTEEKRRKAAGGVVEELRARAHVKVLFEAPRVEVAAVGPSRGPADAKVTIVEFSDFQCPYCARGRSVMDEVVKAYGSKVRLVFRDFPLPFHDHAAKAAEAGRCADEQGKFWELHDWMFNHQDQLSESEIQDAVGGLGLDGARFKSCVASNKYAVDVAASVKAGEQAGVHGTPAFFVNGAFISGALPFEKFKTEIDNALAR